MKWFREDLSAGQVLYLWVPTFFSQHEEFYDDVDDEFGDNPFGIFCWIDIFLNSFALSPPLVYIMKWRNMRVSHGVQNCFSGTKQVYH